LESAAQPFRLILRHAKEHTSQFWQDSGAARAESRFFPLPGWTPGRKYVNAELLCQDWPRIRRLTSRRLIAIWERILPDLASTG
jgi:hypothetical protein